MFFFCVSHGVVEKYILLSGVCATANLCMKITKQFLFCDSFFWTSYVVFFSGEIGDEKGRRKIISFLRIIRRKKNAISISMLLFSFLRSEDASLNKPYPFILLFAFIFSLLTTHLTQAPNPLLFLSLMLLLHSLSLLLLFVCTYKIYIYKKLLFSSLAICMEEKSKEWRKKTVCKSEG